MTSRTRLIACALLAVCAFAPACPAQTVLVPNASFELGGATPTGWTLSGGAGEVVGAAADGTRAIAVTGTGAEGDSNYWRSEPLGLESNTVYRLKFRARTLGGVGGCPTSGPIFCNRDLGALSEDWQTYTSYFVTPRNATPDVLWLRFGQWEVDGTIAYDDVELVPAQPVYRITNGLPLGAGESIEGVQYRFVAPFAKNTNHARPLAAHQCTFNTHRWVMSQGSEVVYRHCIGACRQTAASVEITIGYHIGGELLAEASADGQVWRKLGAMDGLGSKTFAIPSALLPAAEIQVRLSARADIGGHAGAFQIYGYVYQATLDQAPGDAEGKTRYVAVPEADPRINVVIDTFGEGVPGGDNVLVARLENTSPEPIDVQPCVTLTPEGGAPRPFSQELVLDPGVQELRLPYEVRETGPIDLVFTMGPGIGYRAETDLHVAELYDCSFGQALPGSSPAVGLWWASSGWKISRSRPLPSQNGPAIRIQAAKNEAEAAQLVLRPAAALEGLTAQAGALTGPNGAVIPADCVDVLRVRYVNVARPTDATGAVAPWPDPLPPFKGPIDLEANRNQPLWVRVNVPRDVPAGRYSGVVRLSADGYRAEAPLEVTVFDFVLPDRMTCTSAFGLNMGLAFQYQGITTEADRRAVTERYLANYGRHHITPYDPAPLDDIGVTWGSGDVPQWEGGYYDVNEVREGQASLRVEDASETGYANATYSERFVIPEKGFRLAFDYRTAAPGQGFIVTFRHFDVNAQWMPGKNNDMRVAGDGTWQHLERTIASFPEGAHAVCLSLWPCLYAEDGSTTGTVWYDALTLEDLDAGTTVLEAGFETLLEEQLTPVFDWQAWDAAMEQAIGHYHFNSFRLPIPGMGGGTFHSRHEPNLLGYPEHTIEYKTAFTNYCQAVEQHLREKGWLEDAYVYWFDEPAPKDYAFVMNGFRKLKEACPGINRMLTEQIEEELIGGPNIWCPLTPSFDLDLANERRAQGDRFWWYICTGPKAPYATLFIDHPATELRVWLWQTWKRRISGILIWQTNYWTSSAAYPGHPQNPYEDPMGWTSGYSTPAGTKRPWGNGDGRFVYPPEAAANANPPAPIVEGPVDSIRWEMLRDGIEDYEYFVILDRLLTKATPAQRARCEALLDVPANVSQDLTHFTTAPGPIEAHRQALGEAIAALGGA